LLKVYYSCRRSHPLHRSLQAS